MAPVLGATLRGDPSGSLHAAEPETVQHRSVGTATIQINYINNRRGQGWETNSSSSPLPDPHTHFLAILN